MRTKCFCKSSIFPCKHVRPLFIATCYVPCKTTRDSKINHAAFERIVFHSIKYFDHLICSQRLAIVHSVFNYYSMLTFFRSLNFQSSSFRLIYIPKCLMNFYDRVRRKLLDFRFALVIMLPVFRQPHESISVALNPSNSAEWNEISTVCKQQSNKNKITGTAMRILWAARNESNVKESGNGIKPVVAPNHVRIFVGIGFVFHLLEITYYIFFSPAFFLLSWEPAHTYIWLLGFWYWFQFLYDIASDFRDFTESIYR